jgi:ParB family transcriptional regulator, chromosome partitioning protein
VKPSPLQPRKDFTVEALQELAASIKEQGIVQPLIVRDKQTHYELIAGERRWRAAQLLHLAEVPVIVREADDRSVLELALIENLQRENLNPMEEAAGVQRLIDEFKMTHEQAADAVGRSRTATTNLLRLLKLARPVQEMVMEGALDMGHARALLALDPARQIEAAHRIAARGLSVRDTEALVQALVRGKPPAAGARKRDRDLERLEEELSASLGTTVQIRAAKKGSGRLLVHYSSLEHLDELLKKLR